MTETMMASLSEVLTRRIQTDVKKDPRAGGTSRYKEAERWLLLVDEIFKGCVHCVRLCAIGVLITKGIDVVTVGNLRASNPSTGDPTRERQDTDRTKKK